MQAFELSSMMNQDDVFLRYVLSSHNKIQFCFHVHSRHWSGRTWVKCHTIGVIPKPALATPVTRIKGETKLYSVMSKIKQNGEHHHLGRISSKTYTYCCLLK